MYFTHVPRRGELGLNKRPCVSASWLGPTVQKGRRKGSRMTALACDRQIFEGHLGRERRRRRWRPATDTKKVTIRNSSASDEAGGIHTTRSNVRGENVFGPLSMKVNRCRTG